MKHKCINKNKNDTNKCLSNAPIIDNKKSRKIKIFIFSQM